MSENERDVMETLVMIGFCQKSFYKPTVWKYANRMMQELEKIGLVVPHDFGRGKGKWIFSNTYNHLSVKDIGGIAEQNINDEMMKIINGYKRYLEKNFRVEWHLIEHDI